MVDLLLMVLFLSLATSSITMTISFAQIAAPLREWVGRQHEWLDEWINCPFCLSWWVAGGFCLLNLGPSLTWFTATAATVTLCSIWSFCVGYFFMLLNTLEGDDE